MSSPTLPVFAVTIKSSISLLFSSLLSSTFSLFGPEIISLSLPFDSSEEVSSPISRFDFLLSIRSASASSSVLPFVFAVSLIAPSISSSTIAPLILSSTSSLLTSSFSLSSLLFSEFSSSPLKFLSFSLPLPTCSSSVSTFSLSFRSIASCSNDALIPVSINAWSRSILSCTETTT